jgi:hypothetical protein
MSIKSPLSRQFGSRFDSVFDVVKSNPVYDKVSRIPTLDLDFAKSKSLYDGRSTKNLIDFVRNTAPNSSTYVDAAGLIKRSVTNLLLRSEEFETTWSRTTVTFFGSGSLVNTESAPNGTLTADLVAVADGSNSGTGFISQDITKAATATTYTVTVFAKAQNWNAVTLQVNDAATNNNRTTVTFSLTTGQITTAAAAIGTFSAASAAAATSFGNGWFRASLTFTSSTETGLRIRIYPNNSTTVTSNGSNGVYLWGAQLEEASTAGEYVKTTATKSSAPRFDHNPTTGESLGLLVEEQRTNIKTYSESLEYDLSWSRIYISVNEIISPDGLQTADGIVPDDVDGPHYLDKVFTSISGITASQNICSSIFVKKGVGRDVWLQIYEESGNAYHGVQFNY